MELRELRYFVALAEERHFTRAAARCFITQPAFSRAIAQVERRAGVPLVDRTAARFTLTPDGAAFLTWARELLTRADAGWRAPDSTAVRGHLTLGVCIGAGAHVLPRLLSSFGSRCPDVRLTIQAVDTVEQVDGVRDGRLDACLSYLPRDQPRLDRHVLATSPRVALLSDTDERATAPALTLAAVVDSRWLADDPREPPGWDGFWSLTDLRGDPGRRAPFDFVPDAHEQFRRLRLQECVLTAPDGAVEMASSAGLVAVPVPDAPPAPVTLALSEHIADEPRTVLLRTLSELLADDGAADHDAG